MEIKDGKIVLDVSVEKMEYMDVLQDFAKIIEEKTQMMIEKVNKYGNNRYNTKSWDYDSKMIFSDVYRKFIRIENITWKFHQMVESGECPRELMKDLREAYGDSMNYNAMAIQIIDKYTKESGKDE